MRSITSINLKISERLKGDPNWRRRFFKNMAQDEVASEIRGLREKRNLTQAKFAKLSGMLQSAVSRLEKADYARWNFLTLMRIADALNARIKLQLIPAEDVIRQYEEHEMADLKKETRGIYDSFLRAPQQDSFAEDNDSLRGRGIKEYIDPRQAKKPGAIWREKEQKSASAA